jgi:hypothetical protein
MTVKLSLLTLAALGLQTTFAIASSATAEWKSKTLGRSVPYVVYRPSTPLVRMPAVVYLTHLPTPRIGKQSDENLIQGFLKQGMMVFAVDYQNDPKAVTPELMTDIDEWYAFLFETKKYPVDPDWIYIVPAGYTIERKVAICEVQGRVSRMDVLYPSQTTKPVPLVLLISSKKDYGKWINGAACYLYGLTTTGYAGAVMQHDDGQQVAPHGPVFPEKQAARLLRARADHWGLSGKLGVTGHSKGSSRAALAAFVNEASYEKNLDPHSNASARFQAVLLAAGKHDNAHLKEDGFTKRKGTDEDDETSSIEFVSSDDPPAFLCIGGQDKPFRVAQMKRMAAKCKEAGILYKFVLDPDIGHAYDPKPAIIREIFAFFDKQLK